MHLSTKAPLLPDTKRIKHGTTVSRLAAFRYVCMEHDDDLACSLKAMTLAARPCSSLRCPMYCRVIVRALIVVFKAAVVGDSNTRCFVVVPTS